VIAAGTRRSNNGFLLYADVCLTVSALATTRVGCVAVAACGNDDSHALIQAMGGSLFKVEVTRLGPSFTFPSTAPSAFGVLSERAHTREGRPL
jgi:hypothetical protein